MNNTVNMAFPAPKQEYKVLVRCLTYNHSQYIEDALNGFAMQQTNFPFACLVMDDASTDGEQEVIRTWMEHECDMNRAETIDIATSVVIIVPHKINHSCTFAFYILKQNLYGTGKKDLYINPWKEKCEYEALCEGDDYWIDPLKLQKQVGIMESQPDVGLVHSSYNIVDCNNRLLTKEELPCFYRDLKPSQSVGYIYDKLFNHPSSILTCTVMFRAGKYETRIDHDLFMQIAKKYKIAYIETQTSCYRFLSSSMMRSSYDLVALKLFETISTHMLSFYFGDKYINEHYDIPNLQKEVDMFFSKYITYYLRKGRIFNAPIKVIFNVLYKNPRLLIKTPFNIIKRLCLYI